MKIRIISYKKESIKKALNYVYILIIGAGIGVMIKGPVGGGESFYSKYDAPTWLYVVTIVILLFTIILALANIFSGVPRIGFININEKGLIIEKWRSTKRADLDSIKEIKVLPNYLRGKIDPISNCRIIELLMEESIERYDVAMSEKEEKEFLQMVRSLLG